MECPDAPAERPRPSPGQALSRSLVALDQDSTIIAVVEMSQSSWLVAGMLPGIERQPRKKLEPNPERLLALLHRWRDEAVKAGRQITRIALAFEAGRDGFWLARWLRAHGVEAHVIHPSSVAVSREHRRAKTDRLDTELLKRGVLGVAAWGTGPLHHGAHPDNCRRGRQAAQSGARVPGQGTHAHRQPDEGNLRPAGHSQFQTNPAQGGGASCNTAHAGGLGAAAECLGRVAAQYGAAGLRRQPDQGDRGGSSETIGAGARNRATRHGSAAGPGRRCWCRNG